ncbi:DNA translocase FtsK [Jeongeupia chitinilytica]|uniref:FtsK domain-containing protein n=1 Tax=Jeongeupia chitinilytica TaxID=1041641 RepID=A0ABQ3GX87_9NEIS|nr:DNA translocase FtsK [Jeongeupia chitinilytica]GHD56824.1 hypothetical protein GCM10007350_04590 [Jeongeupia chitinilytica]
MSHESLPPDAEPDFAEPGDHRQFRFVKTLSWIFATLIVLVMALPGGPLFVLFGHVGWLLALPLARQAWRTRWPLQGEPRPGRPLRVGGAVLLFTTLVLADYLAGDNGLPQLGHWLLGGLGLAPGNAVAALVTLLLGFGIGIPLTTQHHWPALIGASGEALREGIPALKDFHPFERLADWWRDLRDTPYYSPPASETAEPEPEADEAPFDPAEYAENTPSIGLRETTSKMLSSAGNAASQLLPTERISGWWRTMQERRAEARQAALDNEADDEPVESAFDPLPFAPQHGDRRSEAASVASAFADPVVAEPVRREPVPSRRNAPDAGDGTHRNTAVAARQPVPDIVEPLQRPTARGADRPARPVVEAAPRQPLETAQRPRRELPVIGPQQVMDNLQRVYRNRATRPSAAAPAVMPVIGADEVRARLREIHGERTPAPSPSAGRTAQTTELNTRTLRMQADQALRASGRVVPQPIQRAAAVPQPRVTTRPFPGKPAAAAGSSTPPASVTAAPVPAAPPITPATAETPAIAAAVPAAELPPLEWTGELMATRPVAPMEVIEPQPVVEATVTAADAEPVVVDAGIIAETLPETPGEDIAPFTGTSSDAGPEAGSTPAFMPAPPPMAVVPPSIDVAPIDVPPVLAIAEPVPATPMAPVPPAIQPLSSPAMQVAVSPWQHAPTTLDWDDEEPASPSPAPVNTATVAAHAPAPIRHYDDSELPPVSLLQPATSAVQTVSEEELLERGILIEERLAEFKVKVAVVDAYAGPVITRFEVEPAVGVRGAQIVNLMKDLARALGLASIRVVETIPGKTCMGLELPNPTRQMIRLSEVFNDPVFTESGSKLTMALGKDITGQPVVTDLAKAPHMLVAGTTGSGKSVGVNAMILSLLYKATPEEVRFIMVDPKMLELSVYDGIPHLLAPVVTDMKLAANALNWCVAEMEKRYRLMSHFGVRNLAGFNQKVKEAEKAGQKLTNPFTLTPDNPEPVEHLPFIVVVVDEFADLMMVAGKKIEELIARLAQKARAAGIHLILATQRPSVDVITGLIKANIPTRLAFQVSSKIDSRTILDQMGAEALLGQGDMLFLPPGTGYPQRIHGAFVADDEVHKVVEYLKDKFGEPDYIDGVLNGGFDAEAAGNAGGGNSDAEADPLYDEAVAFVLQSRRASISAVQRSLRIGYNRAARLIESMEAAGLVSGMETNGNRTVLAPPSE